MPSCRSRATIAGHSWFRKRARSVSRRRERAPVCTGVSTFTKTFPARGPKDLQGRTLRDFDLKTRLFRYPLSYTIYSEVFDGLPAAARERLYKKVDAVLRGAGGDKYAYLTADDRKAIREIVTATKKNLPPFWTAN